jgi:cytochrome oxidase assembly protein ShyY1
MVIERRSEAVQKGDGAESRASRARPVTVTGRARRSTKQSLYSRDEDPREGRDCVGPVSEERSTACPAESEAEDATGEV